jgi:hypothetical protein
MAAGAGDDSIEVVVTGTLRTGIMAIGGETTGTTITARGATWDVDVRGEAALARRAEALSGKRAVVRGTLELRRGVERPQRYILTATAIEPAPAPRASP